MKEPTGRIAKAIRCYGSTGAVGGSQSIPGIGQAIGGTVNAIQGSVIPAFNEFAAGQPLLAAASDLGLRGAQAIGGWAPQMLAHPFALSREERNMADQSARQAFQSRGNVYGNQAVAGEALSRENVAMRRANWASGLLGQGINYAIAPEQAATQAWATLANPPFALAGQDIAGQAQLAASRIQSETAANTANKGLISSGIQSVGSIAGAAAMSDKRLKKNVKDTGVKTPEGIALKTWEYKTKPGVRYMGAMAQDIEKKVPSAVGTEPLSGIKFVDTSRFPITRISAVEREEG